MNSLVELYLNDLQEQELLNEFELQSLFNGELVEEKAKAILKKISSHIDMKKPLKSLDHLKSLVPHVSIDKLEHELSKKFQNYNSMKSKATKVLQNSLPDETSKQVTEAVASFITVKSFFRKKDEPDKPEKLLNQNLKTFVSKVNNFLDEPSEMGHNVFGSEETSAPEEKKNRRTILESAPDLIVGTILLTSVVALVAGISYGVYSIITFISVLTLWHWAGIIIVIYFLLGLAFTIARSIKDLKR
jgi:hypothetical protein